MVEAGELKSSPIGGRTRFSVRNVRAMLDSSRVSAADGMGQVGEDWMTPEDVAKMLGKHRETVLRWTRQKLIPFYRIGGKTLRFRRSEIEGV
jgi:excisionase family DNA binding protein